MTERWNRDNRMGNDGKPLTVHHKEDYEICLNVNKGTEVSVGHKDRHGHYWWFEVVHVSVGSEQFVGEAPTLAGAKRVAATHARG